MSDTTWFIISIIVGICAIAAILYEKFKKRPLIYHIVKAAIKTTPLMFYKIDILNDHTVAVMEALPSGEYEPPLLWISVKDDTARAYHAIPRLCEKYVNLAQPDSIELLGQVIAECVTHDLLGEFYDH